LTTTEQSDSQSGSGKIDWKTPKIEQQQLISDTESGEATDPAEGEFYYPPS